MRTALSLIASYSLLAACGGGSSPEVIDGLTLPSGPSAFVDDIRQVSLLYDDFNDAVAVAGPLQPSGSGTLMYQGYMTVVQDVGSAVAIGYYLGDATASFDTASSTLSGSATDFHAATITSTSATEGTISTGTAVGGTATFSGSGFDAFDSIDMTFGGSIDGQTLAGTGTAQFFGASGEFVEILDSGATLGGALAVVDITAQQ